VVPDVSWSLSTNTTSRHPMRPKWYATEQPIIPPPTTTTRARCGKEEEEEEEGEEEGEEEEGRVEEERVRREEGERGKCIFGAVKHQGLAAEYGRERDLRRDEARREEESLLCDQFISLLFSSLLLSFLSSLSFAFLPQRVRAEEFTATFRVIQQFSQNTFYSLIVSQIFDGKIEIILFQTDKNI
jgi:hypothetical protein